MEKDGEKFSSSREDLLNINRVLKKVRSLIDEKRYNELGNLSNETIHSATIHQDSLNIIVAVLVYSMYKILQRKNYREMDGWNDFYHVLMTQLDMMIKASDEERIEDVVKCAGQIRHALNNINSDLGYYMKDVFRKAEINKAFKLYEHGISSEKTAELLGVSLWDLSSYIGQSTISEAHASMTLPLKKRIEYAREFFS